jgi:hypothetical protein
MEGSQERGSFFAGELSLDFRMNRSILVQFHFFVNGGEKGDRAKFLGQLGESLQLRRRSDRYSLKSSEIKMLNLSSFPSLIRFF